MKIAVELEQNGEQGNKRAADYYQAKQSKGDGIFACVASDIQHGYGGAPSRRHEFAAPGFRPSQAAQWIAWLAAPVLAFKKIVAVVLLYVPFLTKPHTAD
jgi:hypothetical protein